MSKGYRYGVICVLALALVAVSIAAPATAITRALIVFLAGGTLNVAVATSNSAPEARRRTSVLVGGVILVTALLALFDVLGAGLTAIASGTFALITMLVITRGLGRLVREHGVTVQAVAGGLSIFLLVGLVFGFIVQVCSQFGGAPYFDNGEDGTLSEHIYYSFTILTSTGLGDFAPARSGGRALATFEMLFGQIYLVTVVAVLVSNMRRGPTTN